MKPNALSCPICDKKSCAVTKLGNKELEWLDQNVQRASVPKGEVIFREGLFNSHIFYIRSGLVKLHQKVGDNKEAILKISTPPAYFGLATIFGDRINHYSATAIEPTEICMIQFDTFRELILKNGAFALELVYEMGKDKLKAFQKYVQVNHRSLPARLADALLFFSEEVYQSASFELPLDRSELAELVNATREASTRTLYKFKRQGWISMDHNRISILQPDLLRNLERS